MSPAGRFGLGVVKWLLVPALVGFAGYTFIGPQIGKEPPPALKQFGSQIIKTEPGVNKSTNGFDPEVDPGVKEYPEPAVEVRVKRIKTENGAIEAPSEDAMPTEPDTEAQADPTLPTPDGMGHSDELLSIR